MVDVSVKARSVAAFDHDYSGVLPLCRRSQRFADRRKIVFHIQNPRRNPGLQEYLDGFNLRSPLLPRPGEQIELPIGGWISDRSLACLLQEGDLGWYGASLN